MYIGAKCENLLKENANKKGTKIKKLAYPVAYWKRKWTDIIHSFFVINLGIKLIIKCIFYEIKTKNIEFQLKYKVFLLFIIF